MPIYEYRCPRCGTGFEKMHAMSAPYPPCPACGAGDPERRPSLVAASGCGASGGCGGCGGGCACGST